MNPEPPPVQRKFENRLRAKNAQRMAIQAKLAIGEPNDKYEQEADATAARVVQQINSPTTSQSQPVQRKFENRLRAKNAQRMEIQAKLAIGEPNDKYEQEADATAARVVQQINSSIPSQSLPIQRQEMEEDEELQMKPLVQRSENIGGGEASTDLESAIQSARGSGQSLDANLQQSMGQAMGADFSDVKVHTDSQSDQLNKSIQAKAFTTGQDLFFRQGAYEPSSRGGQELIAHELTHVVQQNGGAVQRKIGRMDGSNDMNADQIQTWLTNAGLFDALNGDVLNMIEAMMQSNYQWMYSGMEPVSLIQKAKELMNGVHHYEQGLIHGDLRRAQNEADFHVNPGDGGNLTQDMLIVAQDSYEKMTEVSTLPGKPNGRIYLRPQGAAIIKIVAQLLGEALGNAELIEVAHKKIYWRKLEEKAISLIPFYTRKPMSKDTLDKSVIPEHVAYMQSLVGSVGIDIRPILPKTITMEEFTQNMLANSLAGKTRLERYIQTLQDGSIPVSMDIYIDRSRLPDVINKLRG
jgi:hypothetical protein